MASFGWTCTSCWEWWSFNQDLCPECGPWVAGAYFPNLFLAPASPRLKKVAREVHEGLLGLPLAPASREVRLELFERWVRACAEES